MFGLSGICVGEQTELPKSFTSNESATQYGRGGKKEKKKKKSQQLLSNVHSSNSLLFMSMVCAQYFFSFFNCAEM